MVDEVIDFKDAAVKTFSVSKNALFECFHSIFGADDILLDPVRRLLSVKNFSEYLPVQQNSSENR